MLKQLLVDPDSSCTTVGYQNPVSLFHSQILLRSAIFARDQVDNPGWELGATDEMIAAFGALGSPRQSFSLKGSMPLTQIRPLPAPDPLNT